ncbi:MAG: hypothetical protein ACI4FX_11735 [Agathobacter sp.]
MMVISIVAIIGILAFTLLTVSLITYRMKVTNMNSKKNFYSAEQVVDDISLGLQQDISSAAGEAYTWTLEHFSTSDAGTRKYNYVNKFQDVLLGKIEDTTPGVSNAYALHYDVSHLNNMVSPEAKTDARTCSVEAAGNLNVINQDTDKGTFTIKNLKVTYVDNRNYMTQIQTDIVLSCPVMDFDQTSTAPLDLTSYALVANEKTQTIGNNIELTGSAYLGNQGALVGSGTGITFKQPADGGSGRLITADNMVVKNGGQLTVEDGYQTWARSLVVDSASADMKGLTYLNNDVVVSNSIKTSTNLKMGGRLYAYGNTSTSDLAEIYDKDAKLFQAANVTTDPADFSSAVLINGKQATIDFSGLEGMTIAGNAYVGASLNESSNTDVQMGESLSLKSDQRAYLVPAEYIAPYCKYGEKNPMSQTAFNNLQNEIMTTYNYSSANDITLWDYIRRDKDAVDAIPESLAKEGVVGIRKAVYRFAYSESAQPENMVYFFLVFDSTSSANDFAEKHWNENLSSVQGRIYPNYSDDDPTNQFSDPVLSITYPNLDLPNEYDFYYNGSVLVPDGADTKFYPGKLKEVTGKYATLSTEEWNYQQTFASLRHKLTVDWNSMTSDELSKTVYQNLVVADMANLADSTKESIHSGDKKVFLQDGDDTTRMSAVVSNQDSYSIPDSAAISYLGSSYPIHLVIARGDVTIPAGCNFTGLIIAGGEVTIGTGAKLTADSDLAQQALRIKSGSTYPADFLKDGSAYLASDIGESEDDDGIELSDYVTYSNWTKQ